METKNICSGGGEADRGGVIDGGKTVSESEDAVFQKMLEAQVREWALLSDYRTALRQQTSVYQVKRDEQLPHVEYPLSDDDAIRMLREYADCLDKDNMVRVRDSLMQSLKQLREKLHNFKKYLDAELRTQEEFRPVLDMERAQRQALLVDMFITTRKKIILKFSACLKVLRSIENPKQRNGFPPQTILRLKLWLFRHFTYPYPTAGEKEALMRQTGLDAKQLDNWFINMRVRVCQPLVDALRPLELPYTFLDDNGPQPLIADSHVLVDEAATIHEDLPPLDSVEGNWIDYCDFLRQ